MPSRVRCIDPSGWPESLTLGRVYEVIPDEDGEAAGMIRIVDDSGEDYLHEAGLFEAADDA